jgi:hypothetical protein
VESNGTGGDQYTGLDRFGRVVDQRWRQASTSTEVDRFQYRYDLDANRQFRDWTSAGNPGTMDEAYTYDNLNRLTKMNRGTLVSNNITDANALYTRRWDGTENSGLDALGNWKGVATDANGGTSGGVTQQTRTHDGQNRIATISGATSPTFDDNGNMTTDETGKQFVYDAWNRLVKAKTSGGTDIIAHGYDALGRRITTTPAGGTARHDYFSTGWQVIEERDGSAVKAQNVWSLAYVDAMVLRDRDAASGGGLGVTGSALRRIKRSDSLIRAHTAHFPYER